MAGIYTAKPADAVVDPNPPGWVPGWPYPVDGSPFPYPPGYTPTLTLAMTVDSTMAFDGTNSVTGSARDQGTYVTNEPSAILWTAAISSTPVNLRFNGDPGYSSSLSSAVSFGTYWGASPSIEFELTGANADDVVTLTGQYTLDGIQVVSTEDITILVGYKLSLFWDLDHLLVYDEGEPLWSSYSSGKVEKILKSTENEEKQWTGSLTNSNLSGIIDGSTADDIPEYESTWDVGNHTLLFEIEMESGYRYDVTVYGSARETQMTADFQLQSLDMADVVQDTKTKAVALSADGGFLSDPANSSVIWCQVDGDTGIVTVVNP